MSHFEIKAKNKGQQYSILVGNDILNILPPRLKKLCPKATKVGIVVDKKIPKKYKTKIKTLLKNYKIFIFEYTSSEKLKSFNNINKLVEKCLKNNFNRSDIIIALGGGVIGDFSAFASSIIKRGINFINVPTTLLSQVDSSIGGKTGVNSEYGKNLIGSFYEPKLVISDVSLIKSLPQREIICGYAEILKHALIFKSNFFKWLEINSKEILQNKNLNLIKLAVYKSCKIKLYYVNKDFKESGERMILNFGHTFAHAIETKNNYSKNINHGEAVLMGMMLATKLSYLKKITSKKTFLKVLEIYKKNNLQFNINKFFKKSEYSKIVDLMSNDKKNNDKNISLILLKRIGKTTSPGEIKLPSKNLKKIFPKIMKF